jgi:hypothetical protein
MRIANAKKKEFRDKERSAFVREQMHPADNVLIKYA